MPNLDPKLIGNKAAGLSELSSFLNSSDGFIVPDYQVIDHPSMLAFLKRFEPTIENSWLPSDSVNRADDNSDENDSNEDWRSRLKKAREHIATLLETHADELFSMLKEHCPLLNTNPNTQVMVRSSGNEDGRFKNSGGHESVRFVAKNQQSIVPAVIIVMSSYLSEKSVQQRLLSDDNDDDEASLNKVLQSSLFLPVIIQEMVGTNQQVVSGNLMTREPDGLTKGVTQINVGYGLMAGTDSSIVTDTFYVDNLSLIIPSIKNKQQGYFVNNNGAAIDKQYIDKTRATSPALNRQALLKLRKLAVTIHNHFKKIMLVEFVVDGDTIYVLQANKVNYTPPSQPTHLTNKFYSQQKNTVTTKTLSMGDTSVALLTDPQQYICSPDIQTALDLYLDSSNKENIKTVFIEYPCSNLCHHLLIFRLQNLTVMTLPDAQKRIKPEAHLLVDPQKNSLVILSVDSPLQSVEQLTEQQHLQNGFVNHPVSSDISLELATLNPGIEVMALDSMDVDVNIANWPQVLSDFAEGKQLALLIPRLMKLVCQILYQLNPLFKNDNKFIKLSKDILLYLSWLHHRADKITEKDQLGRTYYANWLNELIVNHLSRFHHLAKLERRLANTHQLNDVNNQYTLQLIKLADYIFKETTRKKWINFCKFLALKPTKETFLVQLVNTLIKQKLISSWLNICFHSSAKDFSVNLSSTDAKSLFLILGTHTTQNIGMINNISQCTIKLNMFSACSAETDLAISASEICDFIENNLVTSYADAKRFGKSLCIEHLRQVIDVFDSVMKHQKARIDPTIKSEAESISNLLAMFFRLLTILHKLSSINIREEIQIKMIKPSQPRTSKDMLPSKDFSVQLHIASTYKYIKNMRTDKHAYHYLSFEDCFTAIHQHCLYVLNYLAEQDKIIIPLPSVMNTVKEAINKTGATVASDYYNGGAQDIINVGTEYNLTSLRQSYLFPLRHHGINMTFTYDINDINNKTLTIEIIAYLGNEDKRNDRMHDFMRVYALTIDKFTLITSQASETHYKCSGSLLITGDKNQHKNAIKQLCLLAILLADISFIKVESSIPQLGDCLFRQLISHQQRKRLAIAIMKDGRTSEGGHFLLPKAITYAGMYSEATQLLNNYVSTNAPFITNGHINLKILFLTLILSQLKVLPKHIIENVQFYFEEYQREKHPSDDEHKLRTLIICLASIRQCNSFNKDITKAAWDCISNEHIPTYSSFKFIYDEFKLINELKDNNDSNSLLDKPCLTNNLKKGKTDFYESYTLIHWRYMIARPLLDYQSRIRLLTIITELLNDDSSNQDKNDHIVDFVLSELLVLIRENADVSDNAFQLLASLMQKQAYPSPYAFLYPSDKKPIFRYTRLKDTLNTILYSTKISCEQLMSTPIVYIYWNEYNLEEIKSLLALLIQHFLCKHTSQMIPQNLPHMKFDELRDYFLNQEQPLSTQLGILNIILVNTCIRGWFNTYEFLPTHKGNNPLYLFQQCFTHLISLHDNIADCGTLELQIQYAKLLIIFISTSLFNSAKNCITKEKDEKERIEAFRKDIQQPVIDALLSLIKTNDVIANALKPQLKEILNNSLSQLTPQRYVYFANKLIDIDADYTSSTIQGYCVRLNAIKTDLIQQYYKGAHPYQDKAKHYLQCCLDILQSDSLTLNRQALTKLKQTCLALKNFKTEQSKSADRWKQQSVSDFQYALEGHLDDILSACNAMLKTKPSDDDTENQSRKRAKHSAKALVSQSITNTNDAPSASASQSTSENLTSLNKR